MYGHISHTKTAVEQKWKVQFQSWMDQGSENMENNFALINSE